MDYLVTVVQMVLQVFQVVKAIQVIELYSNFSFEYIIFFLYWSGDVGEPGIGGGFSPPGAKGERGQYE